MKLDRNGYAPSLFNTEEGFCYIHKDYCQTVRHEIYTSANRSISKKYGMWINVCPQCHNIGAHAIHNAPEKYEYLKVEGQELFEQEYPEEDFLAVFGKNYL